MYPGVIVEFNDQSEVNNLAISEVRNKPLFAALFTSDKGTEDWTRVSGEEFFTMYGKNINFSRHGQPLLQAAMSINAGAELLCKRLVASDATLANLGIVATIGEAEVQARNADGNLLFLDAEGNQTVEETDTPVMTTIPQVSYSLKTVENAKDISDVEFGLTNEGTNGLGENDYLLYIITDNGRGSSKKRIKIDANYKLSKSLTYTLYTLYVMEGNEVVESMTFSINPNIVVQGMNISLYSMINNKSTQLKCVDDSSGMENFISALTAKLNEGRDDNNKLTEADLYKLDVLFGCTNKGVTLDSFVINHGEGATDLAYNYGQMLKSGNNGVFGNYPIKNTEEFSKQAVAALNGEYDPAIFNVDQYRLTAIVDANYPEDVKRAIEALATFREDFMYFRDQGLGKNSIELVKDTCDREVHNMFCATYFQSYDILDPYSKKQISVTIGYDLAQLLVKHCDNGTILPTAGMKHKMVIPSAIYGTLSFSPAICPDPIGNQKEILEDMRVNYASYIDNQLVIETLYTSQEKYTQWSFINNVMGIQEVIKAIRIRCPVIRYTFIDGDDLEKYKADVEEVIAPFRSNFKVLELEYKEDATYSANKIFYAGLNVVYKDFIQTEWFKVTALSAVDVLNT